MIFAGPSGMIPLGYRVRSFGFLHGGADASREDGNAPFARSASFEDRRGWDQRDCPPRTGCAVDCPLKWLARARFSWPLPAEMTDSALEAAPFAAAGTKQDHRRHAEPDWPATTPSSGASRCFWRFTAPQTSTVQVPPKPIRGAHQQ